MSEKTLYIFDLDGTLVETWGVAPLPGVLEKLDALVKDGASIAVATNQAGIAWGAMTKQEKFPTPDNLGPRFDEIARLLPPLQNARWFAAIHDKRVRLSEKRYTTLADALENASQSLELTVSAELVWRKPQPGMLLAACESYAVAPEAAVFVGDMDSDFEAATAAGMDFVNAEDFFK